MKKISYTFAVTCLLLVAGCTPKIQSHITEQHPTLDYREEVTIIGVDGEKPEPANKIGMLSVGDTGFTTKCSWQQVMDIVEEEARKLGGNVVKITKHKKPDLWSTCHRIKADIYKTTD